MIKFIAAAALLVMSAAAYGGEDSLYMPFPEAHVTEAQWADYRSMIVDSYGSTLRQFPDEHLEVMHSSDEVMHFAFTKQGHPAHPAWITRKAKDGSVNQIGYFAGQEAPFAELFRAYLDLTNRTLESTPDELDHP